MVFSPFVPKLKPFLARNLRFFPGLAYVATVAAFLFICSHFYLPGKGFTYLIEFGEREEAHYLPELRAINHYSLPDSNGYDGQAYAQIAMRPHLGDPVLQEAIGNVSYRGRRILFSWTAWLLAGGNPARALHIFSVQNILAWLLLAGLLLRWFPPVNWNNWVRWVGVMFSFGLCFSVRGSLLDGPSLVLIAGSMLLLESGRPWLGAALLGISGLGRETNILALAAIVPEGRTRRAWLVAIGRWALALLPLLLWTAILSWRFGHGGETGARNFAAPFAGYVGKWAEIGVFARDKPAWIVWRSVFIHVGLTAQWAFFVLRPRWRDRWWRLGAAYAALLVVLGPAVWEGYPGAAARVLLPMALAFNILVPRGRSWWILLLLGNLSVFASPDWLRPPGRESFRAEGPRDLRIVAGSGKTVEALFDEHWRGPEKSWLEYWQWTGGDAAVVFRNPHPFPVPARISFDLRAKGRRIVTVQTADRTLWMGVVDPGNPRKVRLPEILLPPGDMPWRFTTDRPPVPPSADDPRALAFSLRNLEIDLAPPAALPKP